MAISGKPKKTVGFKPKEDNENIDALINKGGSSVASNRVKDEEEEDKIVQQQLRLPQSINKQIDKVRKKLPALDKAKRSRHGWIVQAVIEKLERDEKKYK